MGIVIVHPTMGIYLGSFLGQGFFSMLDCVGQDEGAVFLTEADARTHLKSWESNNDPGDYRFVEVPTDGHWATVEQLDAAGLAEFTAPIKAARLLDMPVAGRA